jgi:hypothetical protein
MQFKMAMDLQKNEFLVKMDSQCLTALMKVINGSSNEKAVASAVEIIDQLISVFQSDAISNLKKKDSRLNV